MTEKRKISLAENLNRLLTERDWTMKSTAKKIEMSKSTLHTWCCGVLPKNLLCLVDLAELFEISLDELVLGEKQTEKYLIRKFSIDGIYEISVRRKKDNLPSGVKTEIL